MWGRLVRFFSLIFKDKSSENNTEFIEDEKKDVVKAKPKTFEERVDSRLFTKQIRKEVDDEEIWNRVYALCKQYTKFSHAPVELKHYERMLKYTEDKELVCAVLNTVKNNLPQEGYFNTDTIGYFYSIGLLSQSKYYREETLKFFEDLSEHLINNPEIGYLDVLYRNMKVLSKEYTDLEDFMITLEPYKDL